MKFGSASQAATSIALVTAIAFMSNAAPSVADPAVSQNLTLDQLSAMSRDASALGERLHQARTDLDNARIEHARLSAVSAYSESLADIAGQRAAKMRSTVDEVATATYRGASTSPLQALLASKTPEDAMERVAALDAVSTSTTEELARATRVRAQAEAAVEYGKRSAADAARASRDAEVIAQNLEQQSQEMELRKAQVRQQVNALGPQDRARWQGVVVPEWFDVQSASAAPGAAAAALRAALSRIGSPYAWGATGPGSFDCSGLMVWSYRTVGVSLPRSSQAQASAGQSVSAANIQPGDVVTFYGGATHVGMYAGNGMIVHAVDFGIPVKLAPLNSMSIHSIRRFA